MMYECRCPNDGKKLAHIARPPLSDLRYTPLCSCGRRVVGKIRIESISKRIIAQAECPCGRVTTKVLGYLVTITASPSFFLPCLSVHPLNPR
ncbi:MAG: hypothetical protein ABII26_00210 [Pseudomonadota bacterium]